MPAAIVAGTAVSGFSTTGSVALSVTVPSGHSNRLLVYGWGARTTSRSVSGAARDGQSGVAIGTVLTALNSRSHLGYILNPNEGTADLTITLSGAGTNFAWAVLVEDVDQTTPVDGPTQTSSTGSPISVSQASEVGDLVLDYLLMTGAGAAAETAAAGADQTEIIDTGLNSGGAFEGHVAVSSEAGSASATMSWTTSGADTLLQSININSAAGGTPVEKSITGSRIAIRAGNGNAPTITNVVTVSGARVALRTGSAVANVAGSAVNKVVTGVRIAIRAATATATLIVPPPAANLEESNHIRWVWRRLNRLVRDRCF